MKIWILNPLSNLLLVIFWTSACLFSPQFGFGQVRCKSIFQNTYIEESKRVHINGKLLLKIGQELKSKSSWVNPSQIHLPELIPVVKQIIQQTRLSLDEKKKAKLYLERKPLLIKVINEMEARINDGNVTYEWVFALPFRIGFLSQMKGRGDTYAVPQIETSNYYFIRTYMTHENFMSALRKASQYSSAANVRSPTLAVIFKALNKYPTEVYLPVFTDLSLPDMNKLFANKIIPIGMIRTPFFSAFDGIKFDEFGFPLHDLYHGMNEKGSYANITAKLDDILEKGSLEAISSYSEGVQNDILNLFHFLLFHEAKNFITVDERSESDLVSELIHQVKRRISNINEKAEQEVYSKDTLALSPEVRNQIILENISEYERILKQVIAKNHDAVLEELAKMKF